MFNLQAEKTIDTANAGSFCTGFYTQHFIPTFHWVGWNISEGQVNSLFIFLAEGESSNHPGVSETQPSGEFCGDSKISFLYNVTIYLNQEESDLSTLINISCVQQSSWETSLLWPPWRPSCQPWHRTLTLHLTTSALSRTSRQARTEGLPLYSYHLLWYAVFGICVYI